jgi:hypothetical protein
MKKHLLRFSSIVISAMMVFSLLPTGTAHAADSSNIYLSPASGSYLKGANFSVLVRGNSPQTYFYGNTAGTVTFPANLLKVTSIATSGSTYPNINASFNNANGTVTFSGSAYPPPTDIYFFTINFQALSAGSAPVNFSADTTINQSIYAPTTNRSGGTYTITNPTCPAGQIGTPPNCQTPPPPTCPAGQTGTPPNCVTPPPPTCPAGQIGTPPNCQTPPKQPPTIPSVPSTPNTPNDDAAVVPQNIVTPVVPTQTTTGDLTVTDVAAKADRTSNTVTWKTSLPNVNSNILVGTSKDVLTIKPETIKDSDGNYHAVINDLKPGTRYYYTITASIVDSPDKKATYGGAFTTRGYPVKLNITSNTKPASAAKITIEQQTYTTDKNGSLLLELADKTYSITIKLTNKASKSGSFTVAKKTPPTVGSEPATQIFAFDVPAAAAGITTSQNLILPIVATAVAGTVALIGGVLFLLYKRRKINEEAGLAPVAATDTYTWEQQRAAQYAGNVEEQQFSTVTAVEQQLIPGADPAQAYAGTVENGVASVSEQEPSYEQQAAMANPYDSAGDPLPTPPIDSTGNIPQEEQPLTDPIQQSEQMSTMSASNPQEMNIDNTNISEADTPEPVPESTGPDAIYDPSTGELDIIHSDSQLAALGITPAEPELAPEPATTEQAVPIEPVEGEYPIAQPPVEEMNTQDQTPPDQIESDTPEIPLGTIQHGGQLG